MPTDGSDATAERAHDRQWEFIKSANEAAVETGNHAVKALILINGGAAIAMLAFIAQVVSAETGVLPDGAKVAALINLTAPLGWFAWGVACAAGSVALGYLANFGMGRSSSSTKWDYEHPYIHSTPQSKRWDFWVGLFQAVSVGGAAFSLGFFVYGMLEVEAVISALPVAPVVSPGVTPSNF